jgi:hypothetical protein
MDGEYRCVHVRQGRMQKARCVYDGRGSKRRGGDKGTDARKRVCEGSEPACHFVVMVVLEGSVESDKQGRRARCAMGTNYEKRVWRGEKRRERERGKKAESKVHIKRNIVSADRLSEEGCEQRRRGERMKTDFQLLHASLVQLFFAHRLGEGEVGQLGLALLDGEHLVFHRALH